MAKCKNCGRPYNKKRENHLFCCSNCAISWWKKIHRKEKNGKPKWVCQFCGSVNQLDYKLRNWANDKKFRDEVCLKCGRKREIKQEDTYLTSSLL